MLELLVKNASLVDGRTGVNIAVDAGRIVAIEAGIGSEAGEVIKAGGPLVTLPFVDAHLHMDPSGYRGSTSPARCSRVSHCGSSPTCNYSTIVSASSRAVPMP